jgi:phage-related protein
LTNVNLYVNLDMTREIRFYKTANQKCPVEVFLDSLPSKAVQKVTWTLNLIEDLDIVPRQYFSKMAGTEDIWECRIKHGSNSFRVFAFWDGDKVILTNGFAKKSQKAPTREIEKAKNFKRDHFDRKTGS